MDRLVALLDGPRARGAFVLRSLLVPPWAMRVRDEAPLTLVAVTRGEAWIGRADTLTRLTRGCVALVRGPEHYSFASAPDIEPDIIVHPGQICETVNGDALGVSMRLGVHSWGHSLDAPTVLLTGTYEQHSAIGNDLLDTLPPVVVVERRPDDALLSLVAHELANEVPGQQAVLDRLLDALLVDTLRRFYAEQPGDGATWWRGHRDPIVGEALRLIHDEPQHAWTISALARTIGTSRANLARRFSEIVGQPIITYLTRWRLSLAADLITQPGATVTSVAARVGYATPFALSTAFKRRYGLSPHEHRTAVQQSLHSPVESVQG